MSDLKPCPFCGSEIEFIPSHVEEQNFVNSASIICRKCRKEYVGATFIVPGEIESEELTNNILINWWNTRPAEDAKDKEIERLKAALEKIYHISFGNAPDKVKIEFIKTAVHGAVHKNADAPDTNVGTKGE